MEIIFNETMRSTVNQELFLANEKNKTRLIHMLTNKFKNSNITVNQALDNADTLIVNTAIDLSLTNETVVIVGEGKGTIERRIYSTNSLQSPKDTKKSILFVHAFFGCDTTSSFYRKDNICKAGEMFILALYNASEKETNLNNYRYQCFAKNVSSSKNVLLTIPPSEAAAREHSFRVYHQIQMWLGNEKIPVEWGWHLKSCTASCGCRKHGLKCSTICGYCKRNSCLNAMEAIDENDIESISDEGNKSKKEADEITAANQECEGKSFERLSVETEYNSISTFSSEPEIIKEIEEEKPPFNVKTFLEEQKEYYIYNNDRKVIEEIMEHLLNENKNRCCAMQKFKKSIKDIPNDNYNDYENEEIDIEQKFINSDIDSLFTVKKRKFDPSKQEDNLKRLDISSKGEVYLDIFGRSQKREDLFLSLSIRDFHESDDPKCFLPINYSCLINT
ncbi:uncharacterized protein LOC114129279 isoform X2 [Aphis gossypii]|uniref:uncharacterized protein LOC114129279 isoform X2 n=1 Tax=Aphis gossypii TaxID=80765 RepID=UPI002158ABE6|nr:uncharacterized protein LOC114129279 isoform X2 [Aphis gossypii]